MKLKLGSFAIYATLALVVLKTAGLIHISFFMMLTPIWLWLAGFIVTALFFFLIGLIGVFIQWSVKTSDEASRKRDDKREM